MTLIYSILLISLQPTTDEQPIPWTFKPRIQIAMAVSSQSIDSLAPSKPNLTEISTSAFFRRLSFDMRGLPPSPEEIQEFLGTPEKDRVVRWVNRFLDSPAFGEKQAQSWLDAVRFAETNGFEADGDRPHAWRYRDWVIEAMNLDMPYDRFIMAQIAGDLMGPADFPGLSPEEARKQGLIATGFHRCGPAHMVSGNVDKAQLRNEFLTEATTTLGSAILGLTIQCARCHDHKFDPITQDDYYRLQAFLARIEPTDSPLATAADTAALAAIRASIEMRMVPIRKTIGQIDEPARKAALRVKIARLPTDVRKVMDIPTAKRTADETALLQRFQPAIKVEWDDVIAQLSPSQLKTRSELKSRLVELLRSMPPPSAHAWGVKEGPAVVHHLLKRGQVNALGPVAAPGFPEALKGSVPPVQGNDRMALARWLTSPANPLTARVAVNRIWRQYFGSGLVQPAEDDFGSRANPAQQKLLDFLAQELIRNNWSTKAIHRLIATSTAYRGTEFPGNTPRRRRLTSEEIRDSVQFISGTLNTRMGGPGVRITLEPEVLDLIFTEAEPDGLWLTPAKKSEEARRSVYLLAKRNVKVPLLEAFDQPDLLNPCSKRPDSTHAPQALIMWNSPWMRDQARLTGKRASLAGPTSEQQVEALFLYIYNRPSTLAERSLALNAAKSSNGLTDLALAMYNSNGFLYAD